VTESGVALRSKTLPRLRRSGNRAEASWSAVAVTPLSGGRRLLRGKKNPRPAGGRGWV